MRDNPRTLAERLRDHADRIYDQGLAASLRSIADAFDVAVNATGEDFDFKRIIATWARARRALAAAEGHPIG